MYVSAQLGISYSTVQKIAKTHNYHAYKTQVVQALRTGDNMRRMQFCAQMAVKIEDDQYFLKKILWTDEAKFHNNGRVNHYNSHYWSDSNPHKFVENNFQVRWGVNVWCGLIDDQLIGPYFFNENLKGQMYVNM